MKTLYVNGDSWTAGNGVLDDPAFDNLTKMQKTKVNLYNYAWPVYLAEGLGIDELVNDSIGGGSNDRIVRTTIDFILSRSPEERKNVLVVVGWTTVNRSEIFISLDPPFSSGWRRFNVAQLPLSDRDVPLAMLPELDKYREFAASYLYNEFNALEVFCRQVSLLRRFLEVHQVKHLFFSALTNATSIFNVKENSDRLQRYLDEIRGPNILDLGYTFANYVYDNNLPRAKCHHPLIESHKAWAERLKTELKERNIYERPAA